MRRAWSFIWVAVLAGCGATVGDVYVPTYAPMNALPTALLEGTLVIENGCVWIDSAEEERWLVLWPEGTSVTSRDGETLVQQDGRNVPVGVRVQLGGGEYTEDNYPFVVELVGEEIRPACRESGLYWLGYELEQLDG